MSFLPQIGNEVQTPDFGGRVAAMEEAAKTLGIGGKVAFLPMFCYFCPRRYVGLGFIATCLLAFVFVCEKCQHETAFSCAMPAPTNVELTR